jgi:hypothetical protein
LDLQTLFLDFPEQTIVLLGRIQENTERPEMIGSFRGGQTPENRLQRVGESLAEARQLIDQIEKQIESRTVLAAKLQGDIEAYDQLAAVKQSQVEAVARLLRDLLRENGQRSLRQNIAISIVFFVLGVIVTVLVTH